MTRVQVPVEDLQVGDKVVGFLFDGGATRAIDKIDTELIFDPMRERNLTRYRLWFGTTTLTVGEGSNLAVERDRDPREC